MRRGIFVVLIAAACAVALWGFFKLQEGRVGEKLDGLTAIEDPAERIDALLAFAGEHPDLTPEYVQAATEGLTTAIVTLRENAGAPAFIDSLIGQGIPEQLVTPLLSEEHFILLVNLYYGEQEGLAERADGIARLILERGDGTAQVLLGSAHIRGAILRALEERWPTTFPDPELTIALAEAGLAAEGETPEWFEPVLINAYRPLLTEHELLNGEGTAAGLIDSLLASSPGPAHDYALHYHRFSRLMEADDAAAMESARRVADLMAGHGDMTSLNSMGYRLVDSGLDPELGLALCEQSLEFATAPDDSANVLDSVGWAHYRLGAYDAAEEALLKAIALTPGTPALDDVMVTHLLAVYDAADDADGAVELLAPIVARSPDPVANGGDALMQWAARAGMTAPLESIVAEHRYGGIEDAPAFTLTAEDGTTVGLEDCAGAVLVLNFWGAG